MMGDFTLFLGKFLRQGTAIASLAPSSPWLSRTTVRNIDWAKAKILVELGAGTGPITRVLAEKAAPGCKVIVLERDPDFCRLLRERFDDRPDFQIIEGDVRDLATILSDRGIGQADHIVSGLPVPSFPVDLRQALFRVVGQVLKPEGTFNQITELPFVYWNFYRRYFESVHFVFEPRNLPPAGAYFCRGVKPIP
jgi:phosphatidylethanolamine/phosphatidyl-N-methylethanolamine N-methyltransferase